MALQSEYRQKYCESNEDSRKENYKEMLRFRNKRKSYELRHTPIIWLDQEGNVNDDYESEDSDENVVKEKLESPLPIKKQTPVPLHQCKGVQVNGLIEKVDVGVQSPSRTNLNMKPSEKKSSRNSARSRLKPCVSHEKPIIAYGWADNTSLQKKRTFNVKAPTTAVRQSALRAAKQREIQKHIRLDRKQRLSEEKLKNQALIDSLTNFTGWQTEYQRQFCS